MDTDLHESLVMENKQKFEELQRTICRLSKENAQLYEEYFQASNKLNEVAEQNSEQQKRINELQKILAEYENDQKMLIRARKKLLKEMETIEKQLQDREREVKHRKYLAKYRTSNDRKNNAELQEARKELINVFGALASSSSEAEATEIGVKRLGNLDFIPFLKATELAGWRKQDAVFIASNLCSKWENFIRRQSWNPFKFSVVEGNLVEIIDRDDENLKALLENMGEEVYKTVTTALTERNQYNPKGQRNVVQELWNFKENRKATLKEGMAFLAQRYLGKKYPLKLC